MFKIVTLKKITKIVNIKTCTKINFKVHDWCIKSAD